MDLIDSILAELKQVPGQTALQLAKKLGAEKCDINSLLYGRLKGKCTQDKGYRWFLSEEAPKKDEPEAEPVLLNLLNSSHCEIAPADKSPATARSRRKHRYAMIPSCNSL